MRYQLRYVRLTRHHGQDGVQSTRSTGRPASTPTAAATVPGVVPSPLPAERGAACAWVGGRWATGLMEVRTDTAALDEPGFWVVVGTFEGAWTCARFARVEPVAGPPTSGGWPDVHPGAWSSSLSQRRYEDAVQAVRSLVAAGEVYQVNLCRVVRAPVPDDADLSSLAGRLVGGNPAPHAARVLVPEAGIDLVSASPELYLERQGSQVRSAPIKGTGRVPEDLAAKDVAENVMIVDLVRNDLGRVCVPGSIGVDDVLAVQDHPGLVHLVSTVRGRLAPARGWADLLAATFPPGSVSGAPKSTALRAIRSLEPVPRGPYCGAVGWVDGEHGVLAVGIRTFWRTEGALHFGTGAGITWGSDPRREWRETELKAHRLLGLTSSTGRPR
jgi:para-aminobenzoate synthetase component 1